MIGWIILALLAALCAVVLVRTALFRPAPGQAAQPEPVSVDGAGAAERLAQLVRFATVSSYNEAEFDEAVVEAFRQKLRELYPRAHAAPAGIGRPPIRFYIYTI